MDWKLRYGKAQQRGAADAAAGTLTLLAKREGLQCDIYFVLRAYANCIKFAPKRNNLRPK